MALAKVRTALETDTTYLNSPVMSVKEARKHLGSVSEEMSDEEVEQIVRDLHALARLMLDIFNDKRKREAMIASGDKSKTDLL